MIKKQLRNIDIFNTLSDIEFEKIDKITTIKKLSIDNILFYEGDKPNYFYILLEGYLKLYKTGIKSNEIVLHYFTQPAMVAEMATLENMNFPATAVATRDNTVVALVDRAKFLDILQNDSVFSFYIIRSLTKKIKHLEVAINRNLIFDTTSKVCSLIKDNPEFIENSKNIQIANILNMAPETLSRTLSKLRKLKIIDKNNKIIDEEKINIFLEF
jgi:CRP/FNR family transcriptional regulator